MTIAFRLLAVSLLLGLSTRLAAESAAPDLTPYLMPDRAAEIALARTAAPSAISAAATVLVLTRAGYIEAVQGTDGFTCLVVRAFEGPLNDIASWWTPQVRAPHCLNPAAVHTILPEMQKRAALVLAGVPAQEIVARIKAAYAAHEIPAPENGAMAYMMSREQRLAEKESHWKPHLMFYFGGGRRPSEWGAGGMSAPVIDGGVEAESGVNVILIPVPQWSDGSPFADH